MTFRRGFKAEANRIALRIRSKLGLAPIDPIDPAQICDLYDIELIELSKIGGDSSKFLCRDSSDFSAVTVPCGCRTAIVHNDSHHWYRQRSNVCHELAHSFLGHQCVPPLTKAGELARNSGIEAEANFLGGSLLMPNEAAIHITVNGLTTSAQRVYGVSRPMLEYRLRVSGAQAILRRRLGAA